MPASQSPSYEETTIDGSKTKRWVLESGACPEFNSHRIARLGIEEAVAPYRRVRLQPEGSFLLATTSGEGKILLDGKWQRVTAGSLFMAPPRVLNAFYAMPGKRWRFAWIRYIEPHFVRAMVGASSPVRSAEGGAEFARCVEGLREEWLGKKDPKILHHWISLVQAIAQRAAQPTAKDDRLAELWDVVKSNLEHPWTLHGLAKKVHASAEYLRRRCQLEMGRSPMQQVTYMRMQRAQTLLESTTDKLDIIAERVGFSDGLVFSRAFKRWIGISPKEYRAKH